MAAAITFWLLATCISSIWAYHVPSCPAGWTEHQESCYIYESDVTNWDNAEADCLSKGGHLVSFDTVNEYEFFKTFVKEHTNERVWVGLSDQDSEGDWTFSDSGEILSTVSNTIWADGEPNNAGNNEDCAEWPLSLSALALNDVPCALEYGRVCEIEPHIHLPPCPSGWTAHGSSCYRFKSDVSNWDAAETDCVGEGGHLVSFDTLDEYTFFKTFVQASTENRVWVGLNDKFTEGEWFHSDSSKPSPNVMAGIWADGEPNNAGNNEDCAEWPLSSAALDLNDAPCSLEYGRVCELERGAECADCPVGWASVGSSCYRLFTITKTMRDAQAACQTFSRDSSLIKIESADEDTLFKSLIGTSGRTFTGLTDENSEGTWYHVDGSPAAYENWSTGEPNNSGGNEDCVERYSADSVGWNDINCSTEENYVCEWKRPAA